MRLPRLASSIVVPALLLAGLAAAAPAEAAPARAGTADLRINEIESDGGVPGDWVELVNTGAAAVAAGGLTVRDNDDANVAAIPAGTTIAAGGYLVVDTAFDLGANDSARLLAADGSSLDAYTWTSTAPVTYARCADGTGVFTAVDTSTRGTANDCTDTPAIAAWPGGSTTTAVDPPGCWAATSAASPTRRPATRGLSGPCATPPACSTNSSRPATSGGPPAVTGRPARRSRSRAGVARPTPRA